MKYKQNCLNLRMKDLKPTKPCHNCFKPHQNMGLYCAQCDKLIKTMTITREQFDNLKVGDYLKTENSTLLVEAKFANTIAVIDDQDDAYVYSFKEVRQANYSINQPIQHNCGFPYGDYSDREVVVKLSDGSMDICEDMAYGRLLNVSKEGFVDYNGCTWRYAALVTNNVALVK